MEVYVDDIFVKSRNVIQHLTDLKETFEVLWSYKIRLNLKKCTFGVTSEKFLGFMVSRRRIETNPKKIEAIEVLQSPKLVKEVQRLADEVAALSRFISRSV